MFYRLCKMIDINIKNTQKSVIVLQVEFAIEMRENRNLNWNWN